MRKKELLIIYECTCYNIACVLLIHERAFSLAETKEKYRTLPCGSACRGSEDLIDSENHYLWHSLTQKLKLAHSTGTELPLVQLMSLMFYDSF